MARALTAPEKALMRLDGQWTELFLAIVAPRQIYTAQVNQSFTSNDGITQIIFDGESGTAGDVVPGLMMWVGSAAGAYDKGIVRIRKLPDFPNHTFYIGETSDIDWDDDLYLTVIENFVIWPRNARTTGSVTYMDYDVAYSDQHKYPDPVPVLGPDAILWLTGATVEHNPTAIASWSPGSVATITGYQWSIVPGPTTDELTNVSPSFVFDTAGHYWYSCTLTDSNGKTATGHRHAWVFDAANPPITQFTLDSCAGDESSDGSDFKVTLYAEADESDVYPGAYVILFAREHYGATQQSIGPFNYQPYDIQIAAGWIEGESIEWDPELSTVTFNVRGAGWWLDHIPGFSTTWTNSASDPTDWGTFKNLKLDDVLWSLLHWHSTADLMMDIYPSNDTRISPGMETQAGSIWDQLRQFGEAQFLASPLCDRIGRLFMEVETQYLPSASRAAIPIVMDLTTIDWQGAIHIERSTTPENGLADISGFLADGTPVFSRAAGNAMKRLGNIEPRDRLLFSTQAQANAIAGAILARRNNEYKNIDILLAGINRALDVCPRQYVTISLAAGDTPRGIVWTTKKFIPRSVQFVINEDGSFFTDLTIEAETLPDLAVSVDRPQPPIDNMPPQPGGGPTQDPGAGDDIPITPMPFPPSEPPDSIPVDPPGGVLTCAGDPAAAANGPYSLWLTGELLSSDIQPARALFSAYIRDPAATNPTHYQIIGAFQDRNVGTGAAPDGSTAAPAWADTLDDDWYHVYALDYYGNRIAEGVHDAVDEQTPGYRTGVFNNVVGMNIYGIEVAIDPEDPFQITSVQFWDLQYQFVALPLFGPAMPTGQYALGQSVPGPWLPNQNPSSDPLYTPPPIMLDSSQGAFMGYCIQQNQHILAGWSVGGETQGAVWFDLDPEMNIAMKFSLSGGAPNLFSGRWWHIKVTAQHSRYPHSSDPNTQYAHPSQGEWGLAASYNAGDRSIIATNTGNNAGDGQPGTIYTYETDFYCVRVTSVDSILYKHYWNNDIEVGTPPPHTWDFFNWYRVTWDVCPLAGHRIVFDNFNLFNICALQ